MIDHRQAIDLAAASIDFVLDDIDRQSLDDHLRACAPCRAEALALRGDAAALTALPAIAPPTWVRRAVGRRYGPRRAVLLVAAALVLGATIGAALAVGAVLRHDVAPDPSPSTAPRPTLASVGPSPFAAASPSVLPSPSQSVGPLPIPTAASFPTTSGSAWMGASPDGGTWVLTVHDGGSVADPTSVSVVGLIDASGRPRPGWPIALTGWRCGEDGPPRALPVASDGSIRLICAADSASEGPQRHAGFAFDAAGRALPGWPVELPGTGLTTSAMVVGDELLVVASEIASLDGQTSSEQAAAWWLVAVSANGDVRLGRRYEVADAAGSFDVRIAANGVAYRLAFTGGGSDPVRTAITAFDLDGVRPGWPVTVDGIVSQPTVAPDGTVAIVRLATGQAVTAQTMSIGDAGGGAIVTSADLPLDPLDDRTGAGPVLLSPVVTADGALYVLGTNGSTRPAVVRVVPGSGMGPRILLAMPLQPQGSCNAQDTGCGVWRSVPATTGDGTLYVPESAVGEGGGLSSSAGGSLVTIAPNGTTPPGWPLFLPDSMAGYWSLLGRADGTVDALAVVPTDAGDQWTLVILGADGKTHASTPIIRP